MRFIDLSGKRFGRLVVIERDWECRKVYWSCACDCGKAATVRPDHLTNGLILSCGCLGNERRSGRNSTHGMSKTRTYGIWSGMLRRCRNKNERCYPRYGGAGIQVCDHWLTFENFLTDMGEAPPNLTLERLDSKGNYEPKNCIWASVKVQNVNRRSTRWLTVCGKTMPTVVACEKFGVNAGSLYARASKTGESHIETFLWLLEKKVGDSYALLR